MKDKSKIYKKWWFWVIVILIIILGLISAPWIKVSKERIYEFKNAPIKSEDPFFAGRYSCQPFTLKNFSNFYLSINNPISVILHTFSRDCDLGYQNIKIGRFLLESPNSRGSPEEYYWNHFFGLKNKIITTGEGECDKVNFYSSYGYISEPVRTCQY
jgi:hypothetical protein